MQRLIISSLVLAISLGGIPLLTGCERTVEHQKTVETKDNGGSVVKEKKVTENPNTGTITKTERKDVNNP